MKVECELDMQEIKIALFDYINAQHLGQLDFESMSEMLFLNGRAILDIDAVSFEVECLSDRCKVEPDISKW